MSAKWMRVETDFVDHPKVLRLAAVLATSEAEAGWYVMRAWSWLSRFCPTGQLRDIDGTALESACKWRGTPGELVTSFARVEWLERVSGGWEAHDWTEHQGKVAANAAKERERKRIYREKQREVSQPVPRDNHGTDHGTDTGHPAQRDVTGRDVTGRKEEALSGRPDLLLLEQSPLPAPVLEDRLTDAEFQVFEHWRVTLRHPKAKPTPERKRLIARALKTYTVEELQLAITGLTRSPHHMGQNDRSTVYDDLEHAIRDAKRIEGFMALATGVAA